MHLAVDAGNLPVRVQRDRRVVVEPRRAPLKQRRHNRHAQLRAPTSASFFVEGPGIGSARSKRRRSSRWQKYCVRKSSGRQTIFAPSRAASRMWPSAAAKFASGSGAHAHLHKRNAVFVRSRHCFNSQVSAACSARSKIGPAPQGRTRPQSAGTRLGWPEL